jgi:O-acetylserine/cysteine efflux transporter
VVGVLASWVAFGEVPDVVEITAGVVVVAAVLWSSRAARPRPLPVTTAGLPVPVLSPGAGDAPR